MNRAIFISAALALSGCADPTPDPKAGLIARARIAVAAELKDPDSAKFRNLLAYPDKNLVCGEINGKNSFGAYSGFIDFYYDNGFAMIADHDSIFRSRLDELCMGRSEEQTSELQSLMRISYAVFCLKKKNNKRPHLMYNLFIFT